MSKTDKKSTSKPAVKETPKPEPKRLRDRLTALIQSLPAPHRAGFEKLQEDFKIQLEIGEWADVDDVLICLTVAEDVMQLRDTLSSLVETLEKTGAEDGERNVAEILNPISEWFDYLVSSHFPDLNLIRKNLVEKGLGNKIRGG